MLESLAPSHRLMVLVAAGLILGTASPRVIAQRDVTTASRVAPPPVEMAPAIAHTERNRQAFALPMAELSMGDLRRFAFGNRGFNLRWAVAPASAPDIDGLGPTFVQPSCSACHVRDGRSPLSDATGNISQAVIKISPKTEHDGEWLQIRYGDQLQPRAIPGVRAEGAAYVTWEPVQIAGTTLQRPRVEIRNARFNGLLRRAHIDALTAPAVFGLGLIEAVPSEQILERSDPDDRNRDGISGRPNWLDARQTVLGRFGWKASVASLRDQTLAAARGDIGLTHAATVNENCPQKQSDCVRAKRGDTPDMNEQTITALDTYLKLLAAPRPVFTDSPTAQRGRELFFAIGCESCHRERLITSTATTPTVLANQTFAPYTDLLLHDLGPGLAGHHEPGDARGNEWRTAPLWGLGLIQTVNGHQRLLHDGRANGVHEAILWHEGEATTARDRYLHLSSADSEALIAFLNSL